MAKKLFLIKFKKMDATGSILADDYDEACEHLGELMNECELICIGESGSALQDSLSKAGILNPEDQKCAKAN